MVGRSGWGQRDFSLIAALVAQIRKVALCRELLLVADGLASYLSAFRQAFRTPLYSGKAGRPRLKAWPKVAIAQVIKRRAGGILEIERRIVQGAEKMVQRLLHESQGGGCLNTSYIERLNATFRQRLACLTRRTRALARTPCLLEQGMYLVGCVYNFCTPHQSLRLKLYLDSYCYRWVKRTPAMAAGLTGYCWSVMDLLCCKVPPPPYVPAKRRGQPPKLLESLAA